MVPVVLLSDHTHVVYFDQLSGAAPTRKLVETLFEMAAMPFPCKGLIFLCVIILKKFVVFVNNTKYN